MTEAVILDKRSEKVKLVVYLENIQYCTFKSTIEALL